MTIHLPVPALPALPRPDVLMADITPEMRRTLLEALRAARHYGIDSEEEGFLLDHLIYELAGDEERSGNEERSGDEERSGNEETGGNSLCVYDLTDDYLSDLGPVQRETPYWVEAQDAVFRVCRGNLTV